MRGVAPEAGPPLAPKPWESHPAGGPSAVLGEGESTWRGWSFSGALRSSLTGSRLSGEPRERWVGPPCSGVTASQQCSGSCETLQASSVSQHAAVGTSAKPSKRVFSYSITRT